MVAWNKWEAALVYADVGVTATVDTHRTRSCYSQRTEEVLLLP